MLNKMRTLVVLLLVVLFSTPAAAATEIVVNKVAAVVNGELITLYDVQRYSMPEIVRRGLVGMDAESEAARMGIMREVMESMIMEILLRQEAERYKVVIRDSEIDNEISRMAQQNQMELHDFENQLILQGSSLSQLKENIRNNILSQRMINMMIARKVYVSPEEISEYYEEHKAQFSTQDEVELSMIIFSPDENAALLRQQIIDGEISFEEAAQKYSTAPNASEGGKLGSLPWKDLQSSWQEALAELQAGGISNLLEIGMGQGVLRLDSTIEGQAKSLEEVTPQIEMILREPKLQERFKEYTKELRDKAVVDIRI